MFTEIDNSFFVIPSAADESLTIQEIFRDVSTSLEMTKRSCEMTVIGREIAYWSS